SAHTGQNIATSSSRPFSSASRQARQPSASSRLSLRPRLKGRARARRSSCGRTRSRPATTSRSWPPATSAGFEPNVDQHGAGSTVWGYIAEGRGVGLVVSSLLEQLPRGVKLLDLAPPRPMLTVNVVWRRHQELPAIERLFETAKQLAQDRNWAQRQARVVGKQQLVLVHARARDLPSSLTGAPDATP